MTSAVDHFLRGPDLTKTAARFGEISPRHATAMDKCPHARVLELMPLRYLMPQAGRSVLDLFSGSGFVSGALRLRFPSATLIDCSRYLLNSASLEAATIHGDATQATVMAQVPVADLAVCHAGFHHVLASGDRVTEDRPLAERRIEVLRLWKQRLAPGGRLIVADVPPAGTPVDTRLNRLPDNSTIDLSETALWPSGSAIGELLRPVLDCPSLEVYLTRLGDILAQYRVQHADPASFFDRIVSRLSPAGHIGLFASPAQLVSLFESAGFSHVAAFVAPTPWLFETQRDATWFVHELFGLGESCSSPDLLTPDQVSTVAANISTHLDLAHLPGGAGIVSWNLVFVVGENS